VRTVGRFVLLVVLWLLAWGDVSLANLLSGGVVAAALLASFPERRPDARIRLDLVGALRLAVHVVVQLVLSTTIMAREVLRLVPRPQPAVLVHRLQRPSDEVVTLLTTIIALSPGTMTVEVAPDSSSICVHFFRMTDVDAARAELLQLERLVVGAIEVTPREPA